MALRVRGNGGLGLQYRTMIVPILVVLNEMDHLFSGDVTCENEECWIGCSGGPGSPSRQKESSRIFRAWVSTRQNFKCKAV